MIIFLICGKKFLEAKAKCTKVHSFNYFCDQSSFNDEVIITLVAFANATGGKVYVGLDDNGAVVSNFSVGKESIPQWLN